MTRGLERLLVPGVLLLHLLLFLMIATMPKGIWADEVLHFAWGAFPDTGRAVELIFRSVGEKMNHGQTCVYMIYDHLALKLFGASYFVFRLPSYLAYVLGAFAGFLFLGNLGVSFALRLLFVVANSFSQLNLEHGWEARPYIQLQATVLGFLWAWERCLRRAPWAKTALLAVMVTGIAFHPFFVVYAGLLMLGSLALLPEARAWALAELRNRKRLLFWLASVAVLLVLFLLLARLSWFNSIHKRFGMDPYEWIGREKTLARFMLGTFFFPLSKTVIPLLALAALFLAWKRKAPELAPLWRYFVIISFTSAVALTVVTRSVINSQYWILQRQWIAASALAILAAALLVEALVRRCPWRPRLAGYLAPVVLLLALAVTGWKAASNIALNKADIAVPREQTAAKLAALEGKQDIEQAVFQDLAHQNLLQGGPVWPVFQKVYLSDTWKDERP